MTNLVEMIRIRDKTSKHVAEQFANVWLARYPRPNKCVHDNGGEFKGPEFQQLLSQVGTEDKPTTAKNPQSNAVCERMHQTVANVLRAMLFVDKEEDVLVADTMRQAEQLIENALATAMHVTRCAVTQSIGTTPGSLVFRRDMFIDLPVIADLVAIRERRQLLIDDNLRRQNLKRREHHYRVGDTILIKARTPNKLQPRAHGPYPIVEVFTNGTVEVARNPHVRERLNIRRLIPFKQ